MVGSFAMLREEEILEAVEPVAVPGEAVQPGRVVERGDRGRAGTRVRAQVRPVTPAGACRGRGHVVAVSRDRTFEVGLRRAFDSHVERHRRGQGRGRRKGSEQDQRDGRRASGAFDHVGPSLPRGVSVARPEAGLLASGSTSRLPGEPTAPRWLRATPQRPVTVAGPRRIRTGLPFTTGRSERRENTPMPGRVRRQSLQSPAGRPPSSRGLGRRPLTAETGVRIPVAVPRDPALGAGFVVPGGPRHNGWHNPPAIRPSARRAAATPAARLPWWCRMPDGLLACTSGGGSQVTRLAGHGAVGHNSASTAREQVGAAPEDGSHRTG